ncbi:MAG: hypothetical protein JNM50_07650 [Chromatiales bacterium]|jgi:pimeloyl-ACP methyl ester carboxylesterase|nr:hypothetical protein [Chromatiales bacterium]
MAIGNAGRALGCVAFLILGVVPGVAAAQAVLCQGLPATIVGTPGDDVINGGNGRNVIHGLGGNDTIDGGNGDDVICGGDGNDTLTGGNGIDRLDGGSGDDSLTGGNGDDQLLGGLGTDVLAGDRGYDRCDGGIGEDSASTCEQADNVGLLVRKVQVANGGFVPASGPLAGQAIPGLDGSLFVPQNARRIAVLVTHGAAGSYRTAVPGWLGWWLEQYDIATLALNRRDSTDYGPSEGGGATLYEDTLCDAGYGVDYLKSLGFEQVIIVGHSKGTTVSGVYPSWYRNCPGKGSETAANDPNVAGVVTIGTVVNSRESGVYAPYGIWYDPNDLKAQQLIAAGLGNVLFPPGAAPFFGPQFFIQPPGVPFPIPTLTTPNSYASYNGSTTRRNLDQQALNLTSPLLIVHAEGDRTTLRAWSDRLFGLLTDAGKDVTYETPPYESLGYSNPGTGGNAHSLTAEGSRFDATARIYNWAVMKVPGVAMPGLGINYGAIQALPGFTPALQPSPIVN